MVDSCWMKTNVEIRECRDSKFGTLELPRSVQCLYPVVARWFPYFADSIRGVVVDRVKYFFFFFFFFWSR